MHIFFQTRASESQVEELQSSLEKTEKDKSVLKDEVDRLKKKNNVWNAVIIGPSCS